MSMLTKAAVYVTIIMIIIGIYPHCGITEDGA